ncbi:histidine phosphatase family protein [Bacillus nitratireducens]|uniref:histidine phosphatase family protein n=1 Tax=Bacillus nitratireducens TaxID=2026193 RepID=UPI001BA4E3C5|nr:histidine phosphatase family protein [Bacillus nitratireducens]QUG86861.1 histidine phosphatase family protein [Bacillus nitratireducens]
MYVLRHGQTDLHKENRLQGRSGLPLNEIGIKHAEQLGVLLQNIKFNYVFSSPRTRAIQTAEIATTIKAIPDTRLDVFDLGEADTLNKHEVQMNGMIPDPAIYKGTEDIHSFVARGFHFMQELESNYNNKCNILLSGHRCTTECIGAHFEGIPKDNNILQFSSNNGKYKIYTFQPSSYTESK